MKDFTRYTIIFLLLILIALSIYDLHGGKTVRRAAFDIGSGSIKCKVADVDPERRKIVRIVGQMWRKADFKESIARSPEKNIDSTVAKAGLNIIRDFVSKARELGATEFAAVGTQAFREAGNGREYFQRIRETIGIPAVVISHRQQALLGFYSTLQHVDTPARELGVWDIGAATTQIVTELEFGDYGIYLGKIASVGFKNYVIETVQGKKLAETKTPNPVSLTEMEKAMSFIRSYARTTVPEDVKKKISEKKVRIVGIGPVHAISIPTQIDRTEEAEYTREEVRAALVNRLGMDDSRIGGDFADVQVTNLMLVLGFMEALDIQKVTPARINMADGLLVAEQLW